MLVLVQSQKFERAVVACHNQRFGVRVKEHLKRLRLTVDVLTLTATPIPRTLYMALMGGKDISVINTPPSERLPVETTRYLARVLRDAFLVAAPERR